MDIRQVNKMVNTVNMYIKPVYYERVLDWSKLQGRKDCEIMYVYHKGNFQDLCKQAHDRKIRITSISMKEYCKATGNKWWQK